MKVPKPRDLAVVLLLAVFLCSLPLAGFLASLGFLGLAVACLVVVILVTVSD